MSREWESTSKKNKNQNKNINLGIPKGRPLWSFFWKEWEYETNCETRSNLRFIEKNNTFNKYIL